MTQCHTFVVIGVPFDRASLHCGILSTTEMEELSSGLNVSLENDTSLGEVVRGQGDLRLEAELPTISETLHGNH